MNYNNENTLRDYALWYYFRYYPSNKRIENKLFEKSKDKGLVDTVILSISHLFQEDQILAAKIDNYIYRNKNYRYIENKMREKLFPSEKVQVYLEKYRNSWESLLQEDFLRRKIRNFKQKGKSHTYIMNKLWETKLDREKLDSILSEFTDDDSLEKEFNKIKLNSKTDLSTFKWKQKVVEKLIRKWFQYGDIKKVIEENWQ